MARPKGSPKLGGRQKGTPNRASIARQAAVAASGLTPLDFMMQVLRNEALEFSSRFEAAKAAAPYIHPRLANVDAKLSLDGTLNITIKKP